MVGGRGGGFAGGDGVWLLGVGCLVLVVVIVVVVVVVVFACSWHSL